jgi:hypothetical protein
LSLALGVWTKYSFMALLPAVFAIFIVIWRKRLWPLKRFIAICGLSLVLPTGLSLHSFWASARTQGYMTQKHWLRKGVAPEMNYWDLFSIKASDAQLFLAPEYFRAPQFRAPQYFEYDIRVAHKHSYLALSHLSIFTDPMNLFQDFHVPPHLDITLVPDQKTRRPWKTSVMMASMSLGTLWTFLALIGTPWILLAAIKNLWRDQLQREDVTAVLGIAYFLIIFLPIPFVDSACRYGYWTPRLILPSLLYFFWAAFLLLDRKIARRSKRIAFAVLFLVAVQCAIEAVMLSGADGRTRQRARVSGESGQARISTCLCLEMGSGVLSSQAVLFLRKMQYAGRNRAFARPVVRRMGLALASSLKQSSSLPSHN